MNAKESSELIAAAGGSVPFARLINLDPSIKGVTQRVNNWKFRGIPAGVILDNLPAINQLKERLSNQDDPGELAA